MGISPYRFTFLYFFYMFRLGQVNGLKTQKQVGPKLGQGEQNPSLDPNLSLSLPPRYLFYMFV